MRLLPILLIIILAIAVGIYVSKLPGETGFGFNSEADEVLPKDLNLKGKNMIITGGYNGIGYDTTRVLASRGASIWIPARSYSRCEEAAKKIRKETGNNEIYCDECDLSSMEAVKNYATEWKKKNLPLHVMVNNAAIMACPYNETLDGFESQFATNVLSHYLLSRLLWDNLKAGKPSRVVHVSSSGHAISPVHFDDLKGKDTWHSGSGFFISLWGPWRAYGQSKTANILLGIEMNERMKEFGTSYSLDPGNIRTGLQKYNTFLHLFEKVLPFMWKSQSQGAATQVYLAAAPGVEKYAGLYFADVNPKTQESHASDIQLAHKLWDVCEQMLKKWLN